MFSRTPRFVAARIAVSTSRGDEALSRAINEAAPADMGRGYRLATSCPTIVDGTHGVLLVWERVEP